MERKKSLEELLQETKETIETFLLSLNSANKETEELKGVIERLKKSVDGLGDRVEKVVKRELEEELIPPLKDLAEDIETTVNKLNNLIYEIEDASREEAKSAFSRIEQDLTVFLQELRETEKKIKQNLTDMAKQTKSFVSYLDRKIKESAGQVKQTITIGTVLTSFGVGLIVGAVSIGLSGYFFWLKPTLEVAEKLGKIEGAVRVNVNGKPYLYVPSRNVFLHDKKTGESFSLSNRYDVYCISR